MTQAEAEHPQRRREIEIASVELGPSGDDLALKFGRIGLMLGAILGVILGITVWHSWPIAAIVLGFFGTIIGGAVGMVSSIVGLRRGR